MQDQSLALGQRHEGETAVAATNFRLLFESLPGLVLILHPDAPRFTIATSSGAYLAATLTQRTIFGRGLFEVFPDNPDDPTADGVRNLHASLDRVIASRQADTMALQKYDVERPDGSGFEEKWWSPVNTPLLVDGEIRYIIHQVLDVTDEVRLKRDNERQVQALAESEARYKALADNSPAMIIRCLNEPGWPMLFVSKAAEEITGYAPEDFTERGLLFGSLIIEEDIPGLAASVEKQLARGRDVRVQYRIRRKDGSLRWIDGFARLTTLPDGREGFEGTNTDITARREDELLLAQRTEALERANAELDEFTYIASHDLKEPLRGIHNYARFIAEDYADKLDAGGQHMLKAVSEQADRMQRLIEDLLAIARLGREPMQKRPTDLDALVGEVLASLAFSLAEKRVEVRKQPLGHADCDAVRVAEVFRNLITNALKYNDKPAPFVEIARRETAQGEVEFLVRDNGIGIKPDFHARVFAPFKRLHAKEAYGGGSGVGLAIVKRIVEAHGGHIGIASAPGDGATFAFTLSGEHSP